MKNFIKYFIATSAIGTGAFTALSQYQNYQKKYSNQPADQDINHIKLTVVHNQEDNVKGETKQQVNEEQENIQLNRELAIEQNINHPPVVKEENDNHITTETIYNFSTTSGETQFIQYKEEETTMTRQMIYITGTSIFLGYLGYKGVKWWQQNR
jgi:hypothetical protein